MASAVVCWTGMPRAGLAGGCRAAFLAPVWGVGVVRGAGRRGSVACGVAQRALLCAFMFVFMSFLQCFFVKEYFPVPSSGGNQCKNRHAPIWHFG